MFIAKIRNFLAKSVGMYSKLRASVNLLLQIIVCSFWSTCGLVNKAVVYTRAITWTCAEPWKYPVRRRILLLNIVTGFQSVLISHFIQVKWIWKKLIDNESMTEKAFFLFVCSTYELYLTVLWHESVKHTVIKHCNNKKEQGENNVLFSDCACSYLGGKKLFISFTVNSQCPTHLEGIMKVNCVWSFQYYCSAE